MSYSYTSEDVYTEFDDRESALIEKWLKESGYTWWQPTLCGNCCGMFTGYYLVNGIGGTWENDNDKAEFAKFAIQNNISYDKGELDGSTISPLEEQS